MLNKTIFGYNRFSVWLRTSKLIKLILLYWDKINSLMKVPFLRSESSFIKLIIENDIDVVFDIGANIGQFVSLLKAGGFKGRVISLEPDETTFKILHSNFGEYKNVILLNFGLDVKSGEKLLNISPDGGLSSSFLSLSSHLETDHRYTGAKLIKTITLNNIIDSYVNPSEKIFLKLDIQGYEGIILNELNLSAFNIVGFRLESSNIEIYQDAWTLGQIVTWIEKNGFRCSQIIEGDKDNSIPKWFDVIAFKKDRELK